jgi:hypothetical protein
MYVLTLPDAAVGCYGPQRSERGAKVQKRASDGEPANVREVFYAAYGSNLCAERFGCYLSGGRPPGSAHAHKGARDPRPASTWRTLWVSGTLYFAGASRLWGGAPAFIDLDPAAQTEVALRAYKVTWGQLEDVTAQESARETTLLELEPRTLVEGFSTVVGSGRYDRLACLGSIEAIPVVTLTAPWRLAEVTAAAPSLPYLATLVRGLREAFDMGDDAIADYLARSPGCTRELVAAALTT